MKFYKYALPVLAVGTMIGFTACSDDDDSSYVPAEQPGEVNPAQVFTEAMPTQVGGMKITTGADGKVSEITEGFGSGKTVISFDYTGSSSSSADATPKAAAPTYKVPSYYDMTMTVTEGGKVEDIFYISLDAQGFAKYAYQPSLDGDDEAEEWWFGYTSGGQLNYMKRSEGGNEVTNITYDASGDITKVVMKGSSSSDNYSIAYTDETHTSPIVNKGAIMMFDDCFGIDMDEFAPAYYAGLLGKATAHLPLSATEDDGTDTYAWTINEQGLPASLVVRYNGQVSESPVFFNWF